MVDLVPGLVDPEALRVEGLEVREVYPVAELAGEDVDMAAAERAAGAVLPEALEERLAGVLVIPAEELLTGAVQDDLREEIGMRGEGLDEGHGVHPFPCAARSERDLVDAVALLVGLPGLPHGEMYGESDPDAAGLLRILIASRGDAGGVSDADFVMALLKGADELS